MKKTTFYFVMFVLLGMLMPFNLIYADGSNKIFEGAPCINPPYIIGNYPETTFLFYIPTSGERPMAWEAEDLPKGLSLNSETGIISGKVTDAGEYTVMLTATNRLGENKQQIIIRIGEELALTPPMGWNSWNTFGRHLTESLIMEIADAMVKNGMRDLGYAYINIDDFWQLKERGADGHIQINKEKFPNGIKYVADYLHERGLKLGIYSDAAEYTCGGVCGSIGYEDVDAKDFADWGVDLLKYDYCGAPFGQQEAIERYTKMGKALRATNRSIIYSVCEWGQREPWKWAKQVGGHYWRTTGDIGDHWSNKVIGPGLGVMEITDMNASLSEYAGPGGWNDPDMLIVGISGTSMSIGGNNKGGCSDEQYRSHMSLWCMMASPLLCGNDIRTMSRETFETLTNRNIIAINQDVLGKQATRSIHADYFDIWVKPLSNNEMVIACLNRSDKLLDVLIDSKTIPGLTTNAEIKDVWAGRNLGKLSDGLNVKLEPYQCKVYIFSGK